MIGGKDGDKVKVRGFLGCVCRPFQSSNAKTSFNLKPRRRVQINGRESECCWLCNSGGAGIGADGVDVGVR
ncbi:hypothetical protein A2U01_0014323 [Trifolium medium]|uniref:Uncharacterized protein n=1 Tax=Trifolium medium TaxID=97028 RepID=A0A392N4F8_9FABA|nr:hypothetical protein [Trifolium medium]